MRKLLFRNVGVIALFMMLVLTGLSHAITVKIGNDGSDSYFTVPTGATKAEAGSTYFDTGTGSIMTHDGSGWVASANEHYNLFNQDLNTTSASTFASIDTGFGANELYDMDQHVLQASAVTFASLDTGFGANELYDMDQHVTTGSSVTFSSVSGDGASLTNIRDASSICDGRIWNSNGKNWTASWVNLKEAVWDLNNTGGTVITPPGVRLDAISCMNITHDNITVLILGEINIPSGWDNWSFFWAANKGAIIRLTAENCTVDGQGTGLIDTIAVIDESNTVLHNNIHSVVVTGDRCTVRNLKIKNSLWCGIYLRGSDDCIIENNIIINSHDSNIYLSNDNDGCRILNNKIYSFNVNNRTEFGVKVAYSSNNNLIEGNLIDFNQNTDVGGGITVEQDSYNNTVSNNHIIGGGASSAYAISCRTNAEEMPNSIINNHIYNWSGVAVYLSEPCIYSGGSIINIQKAAVQIVGNHITVEDVYIRDIQGGRCVEIKTSTNATVLNNDCSDSDTGGIFVGTGAQVIDRAIVKNNKVSDCTNDYYVHPTATVTNLILKDNQNHGNSSYHFIPVCASNPYTDDLGDGACYLVAANNSLAVYHNSLWYYYEFN